MMFPKAKSQRFSRPREMINIQRKFPNSRTNTLTLTDKFQKGVNNNFKYERFSLVFLLFFAAIMLHSGPALDRSVATTRSWTLFSPQIAHVCQQWLTENFHSHSISPSLRTRQVVFDLSWFESNQIFKSHHPHLLDMYCTLWAVPFNENHF